MGMTPRKTILRRLRHVRHLPNQREATGSVETAHWALCTALRHNTTIWAAASQVILVAVRIGAEEQRSE